MEIVPRRQLGHARPRRLSRRQRQAETVHAQTDPPDTVHGVRGIDDQVDQDLLKLRRVGLDQIVFTQLLHLHLRRAHQPGRHKLACLLHQSADMHWLQIELGLTTERQQLAHEPCAYCAPLIAWSTASRLG